MRRRLSPFPPLATRVSLRVRLTVLAGAAAAVVLTIAALLLYGGLYSSVDDAVTGELRVRADDVATELRIGAEPTFGSGLVTQVVTRDGEVRDPPGADPVPTRSELDGATRELIVDRPVDSIGDDARVLIRPVRLGRGHERLVVVAGSTRSIVRAQHWLAVVLGVAGPAMVFVVAATAWLLTTSALRPVSRMTRQAARISLRDTDARLPQPPGRDEIAELGATLNRMLDRIAETIAHERAFVDDASHELRTPLAVLRSELELARLEIGEEADSTRTLTALDSALEETDRLAALAERLLVLARADAGHLVGPPEAVALDGVVQRALERFEAGTLTIDVRVEDTVVTADPAALEQLLANLVANAVQWARSRVRIDAVQPEADAGSTVVLRVADDGPGFGPDVLGRAFDRFSSAGTSRGRPRDGGTGLGLAIVAAIAESLGAQVSAANGPPLGGGRVDVHLPLA